MEEYIKKIYDIIVEKIKKHTEWARSYLNALGLARMLLGLAAILCALIFLPSACLWLVGKKEPLDVLSVIIQIFLMFGAIYVGWANFSMVKANKEMAASNEKMSKLAEKEIALLKRQHAFNKMPILGNIRAEHLNIPNNTTNIWQVEYENLTTNPAMRVTVFGKDNKNYMLSSNTGIITRNGLVTFYMNNVNKSSINDKLTSTYKRNKSTIFSDSSPFNKFFDEKFLGFYIIFQDIEGRIHGSCLTGKIRILQQDGIYGVKYSMECKDQSFHPFFMEHEDDDPCL